jgi:hemolysin activation/secretion protein
VIRLQVLKFKVGTVTVVGNQSFSEANVRATVPGLVSGESPNLREVARSLAISNDNPTKRASLSLKEGAAVDTVDVAVNVQDGKPWVGSLGINNSGTADTGRTRVVASLAHFNLLGNDEMLAATFVTSPERSGVHQFGVQFRKPFYGVGGVLNAYASSSNTNSGALGAGQDITGSGRVMGASWVQHFLPDGPYKHNLAISLDDKLFRGIELSGFNVPLAPDVRSRPVSLNYSARYDASDYLFSFNVEGAHNLGSGSSNTNAAYAANRQGATKNWGVFRFNADLYVPLGGSYDFSARLRSQQSSKALIPGEQFGVGGASIVRGLDERALTGDSGLALSFEGVSPELVKGLRASVFFDMAQVTRNSPPVGTTSSESVSTVGLGVRYVFGTSVSAQLDYGRVVDGTVFPLIRRNSDHWHGSLLWSF